LKEYSGDILTLNKNNDTLATMNNTDKVTQNFCIETRTKD